jgi:hypothetical protein
MSFYSTLQEQLVLVDRFLLRAPVVVLPLWCRIVSSSTWKYNDKEEDFPGLRIHALQTEYRAYWDR